MMLWVEYNNLTNASDKPSDILYPGFKTYNTIHGIKTAVKCGRDGLGWVLLYENEKIIVYGGNGKARDEKFRRYYVNIGDEALKCINWMQKCKNLE